LGLVRRDTDSPPQFSLFAQFSLLLFFFFSACGVDGSWRFWRRHRPPEVPTSPLPPPPGSTSTFVLLTINGIRIGLPLTFAHTVNLRFSVAKHLREYPVRFPTPLVWKANNTTRAPPLPIPRPFLGFFKTHWWPGRLRTGRYKIS